MTYHTPAQARETMPCPLARTFEKKVGSNCDADRCIMWRWKAVMASDPLFMSAVKREEAVLAQEDGKGKSADRFHSKAATNVAKDPAGYGVEATRGYCGLAGVPT